MRPLIVWDADDTLWYVEPLYDEARAEVRALVESSGFDGAAWEDLERAIDVKNVARFGVSRHRFPTSCVEAFDALSDDQTVRVQIEHVARQVFNRQAPLVDGAAEALEQAAQFASQWLLTKGDHSVQVKRVEQSGLGKWFEGVEIVDDKNAFSFRWILRSAEASPGHAWSVGNSLPSDINPALVVGMSAVWIDAHVWEHERRETDAQDGRLYVANSVVEAVDIVRQHEILPNFA